MTQTQDTMILPTPALRRSASAVPVLIRVPHLGTSRAPERRVRRRRLRREVRVAGYALLAIFPIWIAFASTGGDRFSARAASSRATAPGPEVPAGREVPAVSLSLEPITSASREFEAAAFLPGTLLPADPTEEGGDGGH